MEVECPRCEGKGEVSTGMLGMSWRTCSRCGGTGHVEKLPKYEDEDY